MVKLNFQVEGQKVLEAIGKIEKAMGNFRIPLERAGLYLMGETGKRFKAETDPDGKKWTELSPRTIAGRRKKSSAILQNNGTLRDSVNTARGVGSIFRLQDKSIEVGTNVPYAGVHQFGAKIERKARVIKVFHVLNKSNTDFLRQKGYKNLARFASKNLIQKGNNVLEREFMARAHEIVIPERKFLGINEKNQERIERIFIDYADEVKK